MNYYYSGFPYSDELYHHGTKGQKWGNRRYQNEDGSLTALGRIHYGVGKARDTVVKAYKRKHPGLMNDAELAEEINRQKKLNELKKAREEGSKGSAKEKVREIMWGGAKTAVTTLATQSMIKIGQGIGDRILETNQQKTIRELTEKKNIEEATKALYEAYGKTKDEVKKFRDAENANREAEKAAKEAKREEARARKRQANQAAEYERQRKEQIKAEAQNAHADSEYRLRQARMKQEQAAQRRQETERIKSKAQQVYERRQKAKEIVDTIFRNERIRNAEYKDSMTAMRKRAEFNAAKRRALQLAEEGSKISVANLFFDGNIDG